ncbi:MAG TPA: hypothetical protein VFD91_16635, partial [Mariniphaga sp.]|nr:hypothetical protein [Mariniphaga sp.]
GYQSLTVSFLPFGMPGSSFCNTVIGISIGGISVAPGCNLGTFWYFSTWGKVHFIFLNISFLVTLLYENVFNEIRQHEIVR